MTGAAVSVPATVTGLLIIVLAITWRRAKAETARQWQSLDEHLHAMQALDRLNPRGKPAMTDTALHYMEELKWERAAARVVRDELARREERIAYLDQMFTRLLDGVASPDDPQLDLTQLVRDTRARVLSAPRQG